MTVIEVAIGPGGAPGMFRVEVVASPAGEASATVELNADALLARRGLLQQAVLASAVPSRRVLPETEQPLREVGQMLFAGLLGTGEVAGRYRAAAAVAAERREGLRVVLRIETPALAGLPWEAMYDEAAGAYVCRRDQLVRHVPVASVPAPLRIRPPLRILGVVSSPRGLPPLDVDKEQDQLARALARPIGQGLAEVHWAPTATWADLQNLLLDGEWHVLHFTGHGDFDSTQDEGVLALTREDGRADLVAAHRLTDLLHQARPMPRLVVLNSCAGAATGTSDLFSGTAAALVRSGVSAVAAMQYQISDPAAVAFARGFYAAIARGRGVDDAVSSGRVAILGLSNWTLEWVTPVLYLRGHDTCLFTFPALAEDRNRDGADMSPAGEEHVSPGQGPTPRRTKMVAAWAAGATALVAGLIAAHAALGSHGPGSGSHGPGSHGSSTTIARVYSGASYGFNAPNRIATDSNHVWVTNPPGNSVTELNASDGSQVRTLTGANYGFDGPVGIADDGTHVWVANTSGNSVTELNASDGSLVRTLADANYSFDAPVGIADDGTHVWVANTSGNSVTELNASDGSQVRTLAGASYSFSRPYAIADDGTHVWVANTNGNSVTELNASDGSLVRTLTGASYGFSYPAGIADDGTHVWVANTNGNSVTELNASDGSQVRTLAGASYSFSAPRTIALDGTHVWVANATGNSVTDLNASDGSWVATLNGPNYGFYGPWGIVADGTHVWVTNSGGNSVTELTAGR